MKQVKYKNNKYRIAVSMLLFKNSIAKKANKKTTI